MKALTRVAISAFALLVGPASAHAKGPLTITTSVSNRFLYFADTITARVTVVADRRQVDPATIRLSAPFGQWDQVAPMRTASTSAGLFALRSWSFDIVCVQTTCLPSRKRLALRLPPATVSARRVDGSTVTVREAWPALTIAARFGPAPPDGIPRFALDQSLASPTYRFGPAPLAFGLDAAAALLVCLALWIVFREVRRSHPTRVHEDPPLLRALSFVRQAKSRSPVDRRLAAGLLARTLAVPPDEDLSSAAARVAWSANDPEPEHLEELAQLVEARRGEPS
jgi:hypothetical protein